MVLYIYTEIRKVVIVLSYTVKIDMNKMQLNRSGKADGYLPEVRRGNGIHTPKAHKKKHKDLWKKEVKEAY